MLEDKTDEELMLLYQLGDEPAFTVLFKRHSARIYAFLRSKLRDEAFVQDVFQATFIKLHNTRSKYNSSLAFLPWLFTVCKNEMIDALRKQSRKQEHEVLSEALVEAAIQEEEESNVQLDLSKVPEAQKAVLQLRYQDELSFNEIAEKLNTTSSNARQLVSRAIREVRKIYEQR